MGRPRVANKVDEGQGSWLSLLLGANLRGEWTNCNVGQEWLAIEISDGIVTASNLSFQSLMLIVIRLTVLKNKAITLNRFVIN